MRYLQKILVSFSVALLLAACANDELAGTAQPEVAEGMMRVHLQYSLNDLGIKQTRASLVKGDEPGITSVKMLCFNNTGNFLGLFDATVYPTDGEHGTIDGQVDARTTQVHFIANHPNLVVPLSANYLRSMMDVMQDKSLTLDYSSSTQITYWTFHAENSAAKMEEFLNPAKYSATAKTIHFLRDRVRISAERDLTTEELEANEIESIDWMVSNGLTKAYVIPWRTFQQADITWEGLDMNETFFKGDLEEGSTTQYQYNKIRITPYEKANRQRFDTPEENFEPFKDGSQLYLFEDWNNNTSNGTAAATNAMAKIIFRVKFKGESNYKYHVIKIMDGDLKPFNLKRNHDFRVHINNLRNTQSALSSFQEALTTDQFSNDQFANVNDLVSSVSESTATLTIVDGTTKELSREIGATEGTANFEYTAHFTYKDEDGNGITDNDLQFDELDEDFATVTGHTYNTTTGEGTVTIRLTNPIPAANSAPTSGRLRVFDKKTKLYRHIMYYAIDHFTYAIDGTPKLSFVSGTYTNTASTCVYKVDFTIPASYPEGLYPITIVMGSRTLTPFSDTSATTASGSFEVDVENTGATGWNYTDGTALWQENASTWNYVYKYKIKSKPLDADGEDYSKEDTHYTIYFRDNRPVLNDANRNTAVGLFFEVENFGSNSQYKLYGLNTFTNELSTN